MAISSVNSNASLSPDERRALSKRLSAAEEGVIQAEKESRIIEDHIREGAEQEVIAETLRQSNQIDTIKNKGYEQVREMRRAQQAELNKVKRDGEAEALKLREHYKDSNLSAERRGREQLNELMNQNARRIAYEQKSAALEEDDLENQKELRLNRLREHSEEQLKTSKDTYQNQLDEFHKQAEAAKARSQNQFEKQFQDTVNKNTESLKNMTDQANQHINQIRRDTEGKLATYSSQQSDPFYRLLTFGARFYEDNDHYTLVARVPKYEQEHVQASLSGSHLILNGYRRNEQALTTKDGKQQQSSSYQSFHESFPLPVPADGRRLEQYFSGDNLIVRVPKLKYAYQPVVAKADTAQSRIEMPKFPQSVEFAHTQEAEHRDRQGSLQEDDSEQDRKLGRRTLT